MNTELLQKYISGNVTETEKQWGSRNLVGISIYLCQPKKKKLSVCHSM